MAGESKITEWDAFEMDHKTKVVCKRCNETWMSSLESLHAKPALLDLIISNKRTVLSTEKLVTISAYAFKAAVIGDHMQRNKLPFFPEQMRYDFSHTLRTPPGFHVWIGHLAADIEPLQAIFRRRYWDATSKTAFGFKLYVCTWGVGNFVLQSAAIIDENNTFHIGQDHYWDSFAIPIWPMLSGPLIAVWPPLNHISHNLVDEFCYRRGFSFGTLGTIG
jgi:hypothetical protein